jgi:hypothetical protein
MTVGGSMAQNGGTEAFKLNELDTSRLYVCVEFQGYMMIARKKDIVWAKKRQNFEYFCQRERSVNVLCPAWAVP